MTEGLGFSLALRLLREEETTSPGVLKLLKYWWFSFSRVTSPGLLLEGLGTQEEYPLWNKMSPKNLHSSSSQLIAGLDLTRREKNPTN